MEPSIQILTFDLAGGRYALPATVVREVTRAVAAAPLPKAPAIVEGVINLRGVLLPVLDIRRRFGLPAEPVRPEHHLIIADAGGRTVALRVNRALDLISVEAGAIEPPDRVTPGTGYVAGIARLPDGVIVIHDLHAFLSRDEAREVDQALAGATPPAGRGKGRR